MEIINKKVNSIPNNIEEKIKQEKAKLLETLLKDPLTLKFMETNNKDKAFIEKYVVEFMDIYEYNKDCYKCKGYVSCVKNPKGYYKWFDVNEKTIEYCPCKFYKELFSTVNGYVLRDFKDDWLMNKLEDIMLNQSFNVGLRSELSKIAVNPKESKGLYLYGGPLTGKTYIMASLTNELVTTSKLSASFVKFKEYLDDLKANFGNDTYISNQIDLLKNNDVIVLDDLGSEKPSEWSLFDVLQDILDYRIANNKLTLFTSRYSLVELGKLYGGIFNPKIKRLIDSIVALTHEIEIKQNIK